MPQKFNFSLEIALFSLGISVFLQYVLINFKIKSSMTYIMNVFISLWLMLFYFFLFPPLVLSSLLFFPSRLSPNYIPKFIIHIEYRGNSLLVNIEHIVSMTPFVPFFSNTSRGNKVRYQCEFCI